MKKKSLNPRIGYWIFPLAILPLQARAMGKAPAIAMGPEWPASSGVTTYTVPLPTNAQTEVILQINYQMICTPQPPSEQEIFRGITGQLSVGSRIARLNLFEGETSVEVSIAGDSDSLLTISMDPNPLCTLTTFSAQVTSSDFTSGDSVARIALMNSPYWGIREDQYQNRYTDLPMLMAYRTYPDAKRPKNTDIDYILYFSDEDSGRKASGKSGDVGDYGRSSDIEWVYRVEFDPSWNPISRTIQTSFHLGDLNFGFGHGQEAFKGKFVGSHPIIYDATLNNVSADHPMGSNQKEETVVYQMVPHLKLQLNEDIEDALLMAPWTYEVTDDEQSAEGKAPTPVVDHLFVMIEGQLDGVGPFGWATGKFAAEVTATSSDQVSTIYQSESTGVSRAKIMGDSWLRDSLLTGVQMPADVAQNIEEGRLSGTLSFKRESFTRPDLIVKAIRVFRILQDVNGEFETHELSNLFHCDYSGVNSKCDFGITKTFAQTQTSKF